MCNTKTPLMEKINKLRQQLNKTASVKGIDNPKTIKVSQELDELINLHLRYKEKKHR